MFYRIAWITIRIYITILFRVSVIGVENIPRKGSAVICCNHISAYDAVVLAACMPRLPRYMAKKELFDIKGLSWIIRQLKAFPVDRSGTDMKAIKTAISLLKSGEMVGIFAQGTRVKEGENKAGKSGAALFAIMGEAPVIPVAISGDYKLFSKLVVQFGNPISMEAYKGKKMKTEELIQITEMIMNKINELKVVEV